MAGHPIYDSKLWKACRAAVLKRDGYRCVGCRADVSGYRQSRVDHILPVKQGGAPFDTTNCRTLCPRCDNQAHREKARGGGPRVERIVVPGCDARGWPVDPRHPWNVTK